MCIRDRCWVCLVSRAVLLVGEMLRITQLSLLPLLNAKAKKVRVLSYSLRCGPLRTRHTLTDLETLG